MTLEPPRRIFVENAAGAWTKTHHDEEKLVPTKVEDVAHPYPYAYGFVIGVPSGDGDCLDCFIVTEQELKTGDQVDCYPIALLEQFQNGMEDHDVIAVPVDEVDGIEQLDMGEVVARITEHIDNVFANIPDRELSVGELWDARAATALIEAGLAAKAAENDSA